MEGVKKGRISVFDMVRVTPLNPAAHFGLYPRRGTLSIGSDADPVIVDPSKRVGLTADVLHARIEYSVYDPIATEGYAVPVMSRGEAVMKHCASTGSGGRGKFFERRPSRRAQT